MRENKQKKIIVMRSGSQSLPDKNDAVRLKKMSNITEIVWSDRNPHDISIRMLDKTHYINLHTGEIIEFTPIENRSENTESVKRTLTRLRDYINTNIIDASHCKWITLTYAENMTDTKRLYKDFEKFIKRMRYKNKFGSFEYITACEPQERGAWHLHLILIFKGIAPFIDNSVIAKLWRQGFTKTQAIRGDIDNIGAYLTAYLSDIEVPTETNGKDIKEKEVNGQKKKFKKGARLHLYPAKFNIYRISQGIKPPEIVKTTYEQSQKKVTTAMMTYEMELFIMDAEECKPIRTIRKWYYNDKRQSLQDQSGQGISQKPNAKALACGGLADQPARSVNLDDILLDYSHIKQDLE